MYIIIILALIGVIVMGFVEKAKGPLWLLLYIVVGTAMIWFRPLMTTLLASVIDTALFLLLLLWIVVINKHSRKRRKEQ